MDAPAGGIFHVPGLAQNGGWCVIEVWETQEDAQRFRVERLLPVFEAVGVTIVGVQPEFWSIHNVGASKPLATSNA